MADTSAFHDPKKVVIAIKAASGRPANFAFLTGGKTDMLAVDRAVAGEKMFAILKKEAGATNGFFGTVEMEDGVAVFHFKKAPPSSLAAKITKVLKSYGASFKVELKSKQSEDLEEESEE